ncbi:hypothetical protein MKJ04_01650 [Pontibacter sp. E15-1]|uniref:hypothetical protein n=1 Tax=Pontibacter sp. E15-1 TaxID=2919918 RepID=UPI001F4F7870|nr:hypothetical protein [Pontibacter sp. E15-1]MCJ8163527.1 hypothetical protein [Pontibacter sp. E15-1]
MIHMQPFFPNPSPRKLKAIAQWGKLRQEQLNEAIAVTSDTVTAFLLRQLEKGNWRTVQEVLHGKPMTRAGKFMLAEIRNNLATKLIMRLGLRKVMAVGLVLILLPLVLAKVAGQLAVKIRALSAEGHAEEPI